MKKLFSLFIIFILSVVAFSFSGCSDDGGETYLTFINSNTSSYAINTIVWADGNAKWERTNGYAKGVTTERKAVTALSGSVDCVFEDAGGASVAEIRVYDSDNNSLSASSLSIQDGSDDTYTLVVLD